MSEISNRAQRIITEDEDLLLVTQALKEIPEEIENKRKMIELDEILFQLRVEINQSRNYRHREFIDPNSQSYAHSGNVIREAKVSWQDLVEPDKKQLIGTTPDYLQEMLYERFRLTWRVKGEPNTSDFEEGIEIRLYNNRIIIFDNLMPDYQLAKAAEQTGLIISDFTKPINIDILRNALQGNLHQHKQ